MEKKWKRAFFVLLSTGIVIVLIIIGLYYSFIASTGVKTVPDNPPAVPKSSTLFTISAHKKDLTQFINQKISSNREGNIHYQVSLQDHVQLKGTITVFAENIPFTMLFDPTVTKEGQVILKEKSFQLGKLHLPEDQVLKFMKMGTSLPNWVVIDPAKKQIEVELYKVPVDGMLYLKADTIDLKHDVIKFSMYQK